MPVMQEPLGPVASPSSLPPGIPTLTPATPAKERSSAPRQGNNAMTASPQESRPAGSSPKRGGAATNAQEPYPTPLVGSAIPTTVEGNDGQSPATPMGGHSDAAQDPSGPRISSGGYTPRELAWVRTPREAPLSPFEAMSARGFSSGSIPTPLVPPHDLPSVGPKPKKGLPGPAPPTPDLPERRDPRAAAPQGPPTRAPASGPPQGFGAGVADAADLPGRDGTDAGLAGAAAGAGVAKVPGEPTHADGCGRLPQLNEKLEPAGPFLQYLGCNPVDGTWRGSVLLVLPPSSPQPHLLLQDDGERQLKARLIDTLEGWKSWRFDLSLPMLSQERLVKYSILTKPSSSSPATAEEWSGFYVAGQGQAWRWGFHSCNGLSASVDRAKWGVPHLWQDVLRQHEQQPLHCLVGGGDQLYNDGVWQVPELKAWLASQPREERLAQEFTAEMERAVTHWLFNHYRTHWMSAGFRQALSSIPQVMVWDDHDIFDGWGSYPDDLQNCPVFQGVYMCARRQYLLWQLHTSHDRAAWDNGTWGAPVTFSQIRLLGSTVALVLLDTRSERTVQRICSPASYHEMFQRLHGLPACVKHAVLVTTVPVIFPSLPLSEFVMRSLDQLPLLKGAMQKTGLAKGLFDSFGHAQLLDDIVDHWDAGSHKHERSKLIRRLQHFSSQQEVRVSFLSGDVHVCAAGRLYSKPKMKHLQNDHRMMLQVVSSAIWNAPPPAALISLMHRTHRASTLTIKTKEKMLRLFQETNPGTDKLLAARNWCLVEERPGAHHYVPHGAPRTVPPALQSAESGSSGPRTPHSPVAPPRSVFDSRGSPVHSGREGGERHWGFRLSRKEDNPMLAAGYTAREVGSLRFELRVERPDNREGPPVCYSVIAPTYVHSQAGKVPAVRSSNWARRCHCFFAPRTLDQVMEL
eukprot:jgi/Botrbrau1/11051/Bobra.92_2s0022.1